MSDQASRDAKRASFAPSRRHFIVGVATLAGAALATRVLPGVVSRARAQNAGAVDADFEPFMKLSAYLTGKSQLDTELGQAIFAGLREQDAGFTKQVGDLNAFVARSSTPANALQAALDAGQSALAGVPRRIMTGWYLGVVGTGAKARAVAYEQALMYPPIADVIVMPSFARGVPGYWAKPPVLSR